MRGGNNNMRGGDHAKLQAAAAASKVPITFNSDTSKPPVATNFEILKHYFIDPPASSSVDTPLTIKPALVAEFKANQVAITEYMLEQAGLAADDVKKSAAFAAHLIQNVGVPEAGECSLLTKIKTATKNIPRGVIIADFIFADTKSRNNCAKQIIAFLKSLPVDFASKDNTRDRIVAILIGTSISAGEIDNNRDRIATLLISDTLV